MKRGAASASSGGQVRVRTAGRRRSRRSSRVCATSANQTEQGPWISSLVGSPGAGPTWRVGSAPKTACGRGQGAGGRLQRLSRGDEAEEGIWRLHGAAILTGGSVVCWGEGLVRLLCQR